MFNIQQYLYQLHLLGINRKIPNISPQNADFILNILQKYNVKSMLEIGCANGYSTLNWANYLKTNNGKLHTIDISRPMFNETFEHLYKCKLQHNVIGHLGDALEILPLLKCNFFDAIFIDAQKKYTKKFVELSLPLLNKGGIIIIDDVIKFAYKMQDLFEYLQHINNSIQSLKYEVFNTDVDDGILILYS